VYVDACIIIDTALAMLPSTCITKSAHVHVYVCVCESPYRVANSSTSACLFGDQLRAQHLASIILDFLRCFDTHVHSALEAIVKVSQGSASSKNLQKKKRMRERERERGREREIFLDFFQSQLGKEPPVVVMIHMHAQP
jgi:hypothetical protein